MAAFAIWQRREATSAFGEAISKIGEAISKIVGWIIGIGLLIAAVIFVVPSAISAFTDAPLVWQLVIIAAVSVSFIVAAIGRAARYIRDGSE